MTKQKSKKRRSIKKIAAQPWRLEVEYDAKQNDWGIVDGELRAAVGHSDGSGMTVWGTRDHAWYVGSKATALRKRDRVMVLFGKLRVKGEYKVAVVRLAKD